MSLDQMNGYGYGGFQQPNPYGYGMQGGYPNYFNNANYFNNGAGQFYSNPFGASPVGQGGPGSPGPEQQQRKDSGFFSRFLNMFNSDPSKQTTNKILSQLNNQNQNPFGGMDGSNFYSPYQMAGGDFGKGLHHKK
jgi:hypothetical protein